MKRGIEIERKFLVDELPRDFLDKTKGDKICQGYLLLDEGHELRIRKKGEHYSMTVKHGTGLARQEEECDITRAQFDMLWPLTENRRIEKVRFTMEFNGYIHELDFFSGRLAPLILLEVEFESLEESENYTPPDFIRMEVTDNPSYKNASLAICGKPQGSSE